MVAEEPGLDFKIAAVIVREGFAPIEPIGVDAPRPDLSGRNFFVLRKMRGAGIGMGIASGLCGLGQGRATASAAEAMARNPGARPGIQFVLILGLALIESLALYTLVIIFLKVG